jgi:transposase
MSSLGRGSLKNKKDELKKALTGSFREHHVCMIKVSLEHIRSIENIIAGIDSQIEGKIQPYQQEYDLLQTIPGVKEHGAASILAEIGADMDRFPTEEHRSSWAGMSPGNNESAGKKKWKKQPTEINASQQPLPSVHGQRPERRLPI